MSKGPNERSLLFGLLALQNDLIEPSQLVAAFHAWSRSADRPMSEILREQGALDEGDVSLLEALAAKHLARHGGDTEKSLAALTIPRQVRDEIGTVDGTDVEASLALVGIAAPSDATRTFATRDSDRGRFRVLRPHARGGLGEVSVAHDGELNRQVALKEIQEKFAGDPDCQARFLLEAEITGGLEHPGVVPIYSLGRREDGRPYYAMRFIKGDSLKEAADRFHSSDRGPRDEGERSLELRGLLRRFVDVCNTIAYAHSRGVIHRDIKPANLLLGPYGETLVVDWGLAKPVGRKDATGRGHAAETTLHPSSSGSAETMDGAALGTPAYMSPEQAAGAIDALGPAADIYSLGATLYYVLTGKPPFMDKEVAEVLRKVGRGDFPRPRSVDGRVPAALEAVCLQAMALKPEERYPSARALADDVEHWLADEPVSAWAEPWMIRMRRWVRRHQVGVSMAGLALLLVASSAVVVALLVEKSRRGERSARLALDRSLAAEARERSQAESRLYENGILVERFLTFLNYDLADLPGTQPLRRKVLKDAADYFAGLASLGDAQDGRVRYGRISAANSLYRLGQLRASLGEPGEAMALLKDAMSRFQVDETTGHSSPINLDGLGNAYIELGLIQRDLGDLRGARESWRLAIGFHERQLTFLSSDEARASPRANVASSLANLALADADIGEFDAAEAGYRKVIQSRREVRKSAMRDRFREGLLATNLENLAVILGERGRLAEALAAVDEAIAIREQLLAEKKESPVFLSGLLSSRLERIRLLETLGRLDEATSLARSSEEISALHVERNPDVPGYQATLGRLRRERAGLALDRGDLPEAEASARKAISTLEPVADRLAQFPRIRCDLAETRLLLGEILRRQGRSREAVADIERIAREIDAHAAKFPELRRIGSVQADAHLMLGQTLASLDREAEASSELRDAAAMAEALARRFPVAHRYHAQAAEAAHAMADFLTSRKKPVEARPFADQAVARMEAAVGKCPDGAPYRRRLAALRKDREHPGSGAPPAARGAAEPRP